VGGRSSNPRILVRAVWPVFRIGRRAQWGSPGCVFPLALSRCSIDSYSCVLLCSQKWRCLVSRRCSVATRPPAYEVTCNLLSTTGQITHHLSEHFARGFAKGGREIMALEEGGARGGGKEDK